MAVKLIKIINIDFAGEGAYKNTKQLAEETGRSSGKNLEMSQVEFEEV